MKKQKINWGKIESDIQDGEYSMPIENGPGLIYQYARARDLTYCPGLSFVGVFLHGPPVHTRIPVECILDAAKFIKKEILFRSFDDLRYDLNKY